jgi:hypothetical protein
MRQSTDDPYNEEYMARLFHAGLVASILQLVGIGVATPLVIWLGRHGLSMSLEVSAEHDAQAAASFRILPWVYLVIASGVAMTANRFIDLTALRIGHASRLMNPTEPDQGARTLLVQLSIVAVACAVMTVCLPPDLFARAFHALGHPHTASLAWSAIMSVGAAAFGANAHATVRSL